jgi:CRP/FNR family transcriptional regulator
MAQMNNVTPLFKDMAKLQHDQRVACQECSQYRLCLPIGLHNENLAQLDKIIQRSQSHKRGEALFTTEHAFKSLYVVRSGSFKQRFQQLTVAIKSLVFIFPANLLVWMRFI